MWPDQPDVVWYWRGRIFNSVMSTSAQPPCLSWKASSKAPSTCLGGHPYTATSLIKPNLFSRVLCLEPAFLQCSSSLFNHLRPFPKGFGFNLAEHTTCPKAYAGVRPSFAQSALGTIRVGPPFKSDMSGHTEQLTSVPKGTRSGTQTQRSPSQNQLS